MIKLFYLSFVNAMPLVTGKSAGLRGDDLVGGDDHKSHVRARFFTGTKWYPD